MPAPQDSSISFERWRTLRAYRGRMARNIILIFLPIALLPLILVGTLLYFYGYQFVRQQAVDLISTVTEAQSKQILTQVQAGQFALSQAVYNTNLWDELQQLVDLHAQGLTSGDTSYNELRQNIFNQLQSINVPNTLFRYYLIITPKDGHIIAASNRGWEGQAIDAQQNPWLADIFLRDAISLFGPAPSPLSSPDDPNQFIIISSVPYIDTVGDNSVTVIGVADSAIIRNLMRSSAFYTQDHYFVSQAEAGGEAAFLGINPYPDSLNKLIRLQPGQIQVQAVMDGLEIQKGQLTPGQIAAQAAESLALNPDQDASQAAQQTDGTQNIRTITGYIWIRDLRVGWVAEQPQTRIYGPIEALFRFGAILLIALVSVVGFMIWAVTRRLTRPLLGLAETVQAFAEGDLDERVSEDAAVRKDEIGLLAQSFNNMAEELSSVYRRMETEIEQRTAEIRGLSEFSQIVIRANSMNGLLQKAMDLILARFACTYAAIYLVETGKQDDIRTHIVLRSTSGIVPQNPGGERLQLQANIEIDPDRIYANPDAYPSAAVSVALQKSHSVRVVRNSIPLAEASLPILAGEQVIGALNLFAVAAARPEQEDDANPFSEAVLAEMQTLANNIAPAIRNFEVLEQTQVNLQEANLLYQASFQISQASTNKQVLGIAAQVLEQTPYIALLLLSEDISEAGEKHAERPGLETLAIAAHALPSSLEEETYGSASQAVNAMLKNPDNYRLALSSVASYFPSAEALLISDLVNAQAAGILPHKLLELPQQLGCTAAAYIPAVRRSSVMSTSARLPQSSGPLSSGPLSSGPLSSGHSLLALLILGRVQSSAPTLSSAPSSEAPFTAASLRPYENLLALVTNTLEKISLQQATARRLSELEVISNVSQSISNVSMSSDLKDLFETIHHQIEVIVGSLASFAIAIYNPENNLIEFPYMMSEEGRQTVAPFQLGEGLTSIVIRTGRPLLISKSTPESTQSLGAKLVGGLPAKSWLGVPLILGGEPFGAIIVQDAHQENRFTEQDQRLLTTFAAQAAVAIRNTQLLKTTISQAEQEKAINEITAKIRRSVDMQTILKTTVDELAAVLGVRQAYIEIGDVGVSQAAEVNAKRAALPRSTSPSKSPKKTKDQEAVS